MPDVREYFDASDRSPFRIWSDGLIGAAAAKVRTAIARLELGNFSNVKSVGSGVFERKIDFGPGYRVYFGKDGEHLVILLGGGDKKRQTADIAAARASWADYKRRKQQGE